MRKLNNILVCEVCLTTLILTGLTLTAYSYPDSVPDSHTSANLSPGIITGVVKDQVTNEPLPGANVIITGTMAGASTDIDGKFTIANVEPGVYSLTVTMISYENALIDNVIVRDDETTTISIDLKEAVTELQEIVVEGDPVFGSGRIIHTDEVAMVETMKDSELNLTGISTQQIIRSVDNTASDLIKRAASVTIIDDFVNIRGLYERYNFTFINGMQAPSSKPDGRAFSFDVIPSGMIDNILIYRSPAPELPADFAGGVVDITTRQSLSRKQLEIAASIHYRQDATYNNMYYTDSGSKTDALGFDDGARGIPSGFPVENVQSVNSNSTLRDRQLNGIAARAIIPSWSLLKKTVRPDQRLGINYYDSWRINSLRISSATSVNYTSTSTFRSQTFLPKVYAKNVPGDSSRYTIEPLEKYEDSVSTANYRISGFQSFNFKLHENHSILLNGFFNQDGSDRVIVRKGFNFSSGDQTDSWPTRYLNQVNYSYQNRMMITSFLKGLHKWGADNNKLSWVAGYTHNSDELPDEKVLRYFADSANRVFTAQFDVSGFQNSLGSQYFREVNETIYTGRIDFHKTFKEGLYIKTGGYYEDRSRDFFSRLYYYDLVPSSNTQLSSQATLNFPIALKADSLFDAWVRPDGFGLTLMKAIDYLNFRFTSSSSLYAGYLGVNATFLNKKLSVYTGARYEVFDQVITPFVQDASITQAERDFMAPDTRTYDVLPSVNLTYTLSTTRKIRASYGMTLNRPYEKEVSGVGSYDFVQGFAIKGYPFLKASRIQNADIRFESYGGSGEIIAVGAFFKYFKDPIELVTNELPDINDQEFLAENFFTSNTKSAINYGVELELRKNLSFISEKLDKFSVILNSSILRSRVQLSDSLYLAFFERQYDRPNITSYANAKGVKRSLTGTSPYVLNTSLYYDNKTTNTTIALQYNFIGPRIIIPPVIQVLYAQVPGAPLGEFANQEFFSPGIYEAPRHVVDLTIRQKLFRFAGLKLGVQNLFNQPVRMFMDMNRDERYSEAPAIIQNLSDISKQDILRIKYKEGSYYSIGLSFIF